MTPLLRLLYVEDEPFIQALAKVALEDVGGFELQVCSSGAEALAVVQSFKPDLLLLDVMMPMMDGPTTLRAIRSIAGLATIPAVFLTALSHPAEVSKLRQEGALDVMFKPFDIISLAEQLRALWRLHWQSSPVA